MAIYRRSQNKGIRGKRKSLLILGPIPDFTPGPLQHFLNQQTQAEGGKEG